MSRNRIYDGLPSRGMEETFQPHLQAAADLMGQMDVYAVITYGSVSAKMNPNEHLARQRRVHV